MVPMLVACDGAMTTRAPVQCERYRELGLNIKDENNEPYQRSAQVGIIIAFVYAFYICLCWCSDAYTTDENNEPYQRSAQVGTCVCN
jgi:hypothetical protein